MSTLRHKFVVPIAILAALTVAPLLTGCVGNPVEGIVKAATGGKVDVGSGHKMPPDFPKEVPVVKGTIVTSVSLGAAGKKVWNVSIPVTGDNPVTGIESDLKGAGFKLEPVTSTSDDGSAIIATDSKYSTIIGIAKDKTGWLVNYSVGPSDDSK